MSLNARINPTREPSIALAVLGWLLLAATASAGVVKDLGTPTRTFNSFGDLPSWNARGDTEDATFSALIDFSANNTPGSRQLIWESGGELTGSSLTYENNSTLRFRAQFNNVPTELTWELTSNQIAAGEIFVGWVFDLGNDEIRLTLDGITNFARPLTVATAPFTANDWTGTNLAAFGTGSSAVGGYGPAALFADPFSSGTINTTTGLEYYRDQAFLPSPVPEPVGTLAGIFALSFTFFRRRRSLL